MAVKTVETSFCSPAVHLLLCGLLPKRPRTGTSTWPQGLGTLVIDNLFCVSCNSALVQDFKELEEVFIQSLTSTEKSVVESKQ